MSLLNLIKSIYNTRNWYSNIWYVQENQTPYTWFYDARHLTIDHLPLLAHAHTWLLARRCTVFFSQIARPWKIKIHSVLIFSNLWICTKDLFDCTPKTLQINIHLDMTKEILPRLLSQVIDDDFDLCIRKKNLDINVITNQTYVSA